MGTATTNPTAGKLGTFGGVFVPNVLTILGVIMFMRTGWVVGQAGLLLALVILLLAKTITLLTAASLSAISTNARVGAGGAYFLISRSLGLEVGGSIGVPLFFAQAISVAFYLVGFSESLSYLMPSVNERLVSTIALVAFVGVVWFGAKIIAKTQYVILVLLVLSLISIFTGVRFVPDAGERLAAGFSENETFWSVFAIFFPAVTGIMAGVSMSGDLADPSRSIPRGTMLAVIVTMVIYAAEMVWLALSADRESLLTDNLVLRDIASVPILIFGGLWAATLSSALASLAAAPRTLQALAHDTVLPRFLARGKGNSREPHVAILVTAGLAEACVLIGDLNLIAPIITMFFLATYGTLNIVAGLERLVANPSYRPRFRTHWSISLIGGLGCVAVMFLINAIATVAATAIVLTIYIMLTRRRLQATWGDMRSGLWFAITRFGLLRFVAARPHIRNWRPVFLVLSGNPSTRMPLVDFANWFESGRGFLFIAHIVIGDVETLLPRQPKLQESLQTFVRESSLSAVAKTVVAEDFEQGVRTLLQVSGIGPFEPNTVIVGWSDDAVKLPQFVRAVRRTLEMERNLMVFEPAAESRLRLEPRIDVWWYAKDNGSLMLTLAYLLQGNLQWQDHTIRVLRIISDESAVEDVRAGTAELIETFRVAAEITVIVSDDPAMEVIARESERSAVCFVGLAVAALENPLAAYGDLITQLQGNVFLTKSWHDLRY